MIQLKDGFQLKIENTINLRTGGQFKASPLGKPNNNPSDGVTHSKIPTDRAIWKESDEKWNSIKDAYVFHLHTKHG